MRALYLILLGWGITAASLTEVVFAENRPPLVNVGESPLEASTGSPAYLIGETSDDSTPFDSLIILWRQIAGPSQAQILLPTSLTTSVAFRDSGTYLFELSVSDGSFSASDTVTVHVRQHLPFILLRPANREPIEPGQLYTIRWQMDPSIPCTVNFTLDDGLSWTMLTEQGSVTDSFVWRVPDDLVPGQEGRIWVHEYMNPSNSAAGSGTFVVAAKGQKNRYDNPYALNVSSEKRVSIFVFISSGHLGANRDRFFDVNGKCCPRKDIEYNTGVKILGSTGNEQR